MPRRGRDPCDENWSLKKVWTVHELSAGDVSFNLRTSLVKPGVTSHQIGARTGDQVVALRVPAETLGEGVLIPLWEQNGYLNVPVTFSPRG